MRKKYKKTSKGINKAIQELNKMVAADPKWHGRFFVKNIAVLALDADRVKGNSNMVVVLRIYDKETANYIERMAYVRGGDRRYIAQFAHGLYEQLNDFVYEYVDDHNESINYNLIKPNLVIKHGFNINSAMQYTKRRD